MMTLVAIGAALVLQFVNSRFTPQPQPPAQPKTTSSKPEFKYAYQPPEANARADVIAEFEAAAELALIVQGGRRQEVQANAQFGVRRDRGARRLLEAEHRVSIRGSGVPL